MRLRTQFYALIILAAMLGVASLAVLGPMVQAAKLLSDEEVQAETTAKEVSGLLALTQQYVLFGGARAEQQWWARHVLLSQALKVHDAAPSGDAQAPHLQEELDALADLFRTLTQLPRQALSATASPLGGQREALIDHIVVETQVITEETYRWQTHLRTRRDRSERRLITWAIALPALLSLLFAAGAALLARQVLRPLRRLGSAMTAVAQGDLSVRCASTSGDEVGDLSRHFDHMSEQLASRTEALTLSEASMRDALRDKETLLKEVYHRVKNNLQVTQSLLTLQRRSVPEKAAREALDNSVQRVRAMALVHEKLYRSSTLSRIDLPDYVCDLLSQVSEALGASARGIRLKADVEARDTGLDSAVPLGLLLTELVSNSLKHAFPGGRQGEVKVTLRTADEGSAVALSVSDNGVGLPDGFELHQTSSMGLQLAASLVGQLGEGFQAANQPQGQGAVFTALLTRL